VSRPTDWSPLNWYEDPVPGDPDAVSRAATRYGTVAEAIRQASRDLVRVFEDDQLKGESFDALREIATEVSDRIGRAYDRYNGVSVALAGYVGPLRTAQADSAGILDRARVSREEGATAEQRVHFWHDEMMRRAQTGDPELQEAVDRLAYWQHQEQQSSQDVGALIAELNGVIAARDAAASTAADAIAEVENSGDLNDGFWDDVDQFLIENPWIQDVIAVASVVVSVLAVIAMFVPGLNLIVLALTIVVAAAVILNAWAKAGTGRTSIAGAILETALALIPFGIGKGLSAISAAARSGAARAAATSIRTSASGAGMSGITQRVALESIEELASANPGNWLRLPNGSLLPKVFNRTSDFGELLDLATLVKGPLTVAGNTSAAAQAAMPAVWIAGGAELAFTAAEPVVMPLVQTAIEGIEFFESQPMNSWQDNDW